MCGIAGQLKFRGEADEGLVRAMTGALIHRGPDGEGYFAGSGIRLGMRRLRVIDLITGDQPIYNEDRSVVVILNGEIYNYRELKKELEAKGHKFYTKSDTEAIVHAYEEYGGNFVEKLDGMFGLAVWDDKKRKLIIARDRVGEKPLYYYIDNNEFLFASEMKALLVAKKSRREIDPAALHYYMVYGRVPSPLSIFKDIKKLKPAETAVIENGRLTSRTYWRLSFKDKLDASEVEIKNELLKQLEQSVRTQMAADVPLGAFLSGGVDSSAVVAMMARASDRPVKTFSLGFKDEDYSELKYAKIVAERFKTDHREFIVEPDVMGVLPRLVRYLDEPFSDYSVIPAYQVARAAREKVTVALTGDGGDELFAGYEWYKAIKIARAYNILPQFAREFVYRVTKPIPDTDEREKIKRYVHKLKRLAETQRQGNMDPLEIFLNLTTGFTEDMLKQEVYAEAFKNNDLPSASGLRRALIEEYDGNEPLEALLYGQFKSLLPDLFFTKVDRASMAVSLETRAPLVDRRLVEFTARIPLSLKLKGLKTKYILKEALRGILPDEIMFRPKKGFTLPLNRWLKTGELKNSVGSALLGDNNGLEYFNRVYIEKIWREHQESRANHTDKLWRLYMFALWHREYCR